MDEEFETWLAWFQETEEFATDDHDEDLRAAWKESALRADRKARIDCAVLCANLLSEHEASKIVHAIRLTIPEE